MEQEYKYMVHVSCMTYNHAPYIVDAMNGFTMQQTTFPYVCTIIDDASTDGEPEIIRQYLQDYFDLKDKTTLRQENTVDYSLVFAQHKDNRNCFFFVLFLKYNHYSIKKPKMCYVPDDIINTKYIAICEGDDYWINPLKIQKQVDFLESHQDYNLVYNDVNSYYEETGKMTEGFFNHGIYKRIKNTHKDEIMWGWFLAPCTWVYRKGIVKYPEKRNPSMFYGDIFQVLSLSQNGKIHYLNEVMAVYRVLPESASHSKNWKKSFNFWKNGRYTRATFAVHQPVWFRLKFFLLNLLIALRVLFLKKDFKNLSEYIKMFFVEAKALLY